MYVCICYGVTERDIRAVLDAGACTTQDVAADCGAGTGCGTCVRKIRALIESSPAEHGRLAVTTNSTAS